VDIWWSQLMMRSMMGQHLQPRSSPKPMQVEFVVLELGCGGNLDKLMLQALCSMLYFMLWYGD